MSVFTTEVNQNALRIFANGTSTQEALGQDASRRIQFINVIMFASILNAPLC